MVRHSLWNTTVDGVIIGHLCIFVEKFVADKWTGLNWFRIASNSGLLSTCLWRMHEFFLSFELLTWLPGRLIGQWLGSHRGCPRFAPRSLHVWFVPDAVAVGRDFLWVLRFFPLNTVSPLHHTHSPSWKRGIGLFRSPVRGGHSLTPSQQ